MTDMQCRQVYKLALSALAVAIGGCSHSPTAATPASTTAPTTTEDRQPAQSSGLLPDQERWADLYDFVNRIDLNSGEINLQMSSGGTSVYAVLVKGDRPLGAVIPENSATKVSGEIMTFNIARALGVSDLYQPAAYHFLTGANLKKFRSFVPTQPFSSKSREENRQGLLKQFAAIDAGKASGLHTVYKQFGIKPDDYDDLVNVKANTMNTAHALPGGTAPVAQLLQCKGPQPGHNTKIKLNRKKKDGTKYVVESTEAELVRQLSSIFLIDALSGQWDRFSGGNLQILVDKDAGAFKFVSFDNGGTWGSLGWTDKFLGLTQRFDKSVANGILEMDKFLNQGGSSYLGLRSEQEFINAMNIQAYPGQMKKFKEALARVAGHLRKYDGCFFD